jgi:hypothetical protein
MTYFGITMDVRGVIPDIGMIEHRMLFPVDPNLPYDQLRHQLAYGVFRDPHFTIDLPLADIATDCIKYNVIPVINIGATEWYGKDILNKLTPADYAKIAGVIRDYLIARGFKKGNAYISCFNEPGKSINSVQTCTYSNAVHDEVGDDFDVVYGNDEFNMLDWNYLGANCRAKVMGIHHLSSVGFWDNPYKYFNNVRDCKTIANVNGKEIIGTECGSWFKDYCEDGHVINLDIMDKCKEYHYLGCLIVLPDLNANSKNKWKLLGYQIWNSGFTQIIEGCPDKYNDFIEYIKTEGDKVNYLRPDELQAVYDAFGIKTPYRWQTPNLYTAAQKNPSGLVTWADMDALTETQMKAIISGMKKLGIFPASFPDWPNIKYNADGSWNNNWPVYAKSKPEV